MRHFHRITALALLLTAAHSAQAQDENKVNKWLPIQIHWENDAFPILSGSDRAYTNGVRLTRLRNTAAELNETAWFIKKWKGKFYKDSENPFEAQPGFALGQNLYTPNNLHPAALIPDDRPYGAVLYGSAFVNFYRLGERDFDRLDTIELQVGMVGPIAQGEFVQTEVHKLIDNTIPKGWDNQIRNEPIVNVNFTSLKHAFMPPTKKRDFTQQWGVSLGNLMTRASVGGTFRIGRNLSSFPVPEIGNTSRPIAAERADNEEYFFAGVEGRLVAHNIFLDGNTFRRSHSVAKKPLVADLKLGYHRRWKANYINYTYVYRTSEFKGTNGRGGHPFAAITFGREY